MNTTTSEGAARGLAPLTPADRVTVTRAALGLVVALLVGLVWADVLEPRTWPLFLLVVPTLALDGVDGAVARRTGTVTARGARWDMEVDAAVLLVLSIAVFPCAPWALGIGLARYLFGIGGWVRPAWRRPLPFRQSRRVIAAVQGIALAAALAPFVPVLLGQLAVALALALLVFSFGRDIRYQERRGG